MSREKPLTLVRRLVPGAVRRHEPGAVLDCLLCAPGSEWVAVDTETGALVRPSQGSAAPSEALDGPPLAPVRLRLAPSSEPWDPSRPEGVVVADATGVKAPTARARRRLLCSVARVEDGGGILGSTGLSLPYVEARGTRPSVVLVRPNGSRIRLLGTTELTARFQLGDRSYTLPLGEGAIAWVRSGTLPTASAATRRESKAPLERTGPVVLTVGFGRPDKGQLRKLVLGILPID